LNHPRAEVVVICGRRRERAAALAGKFRVPEIATDAAEVCARGDLDGVAICVPNAGHRELALLAFRHGKHVFCEKPLGISVVEAEEMTRAAEASGRIHQVAFTYRYLYGVEELRRRLRAGDAGEPYLFRAHHEYWEGLRPGAALGWRELAEPSGGGVLYDLGSHLFDLARFFLGPIEAVRGDLQRLAREQPEGAESARRSVETDDLASSRFRTATGVDGHWFASRITPARAHNYVQVIGREGALEALLSRGRLDQLRFASAGSPSWEILPLPAAAGDQQSHALARMMRSFVDACLSGRLSDVDASFADGLAVQRAFTAAGSSTEYGWISLDPPA
jgi:predicted dehydrogenase